MKIQLNKKATSIAEALVVMLIIVTWVTWMYNILKKSTDLTTSVENKIKAIQIARQWIEAFTNIRDTNWILFSSDYKNCWNVLNYNSNCIWNATNANDIANNWSYVIYKDSNSRWKLASKATWIYSNATYINNFRVWLDSGWIYTQTWTLNNLTPFFTRELKITYTWNNSNNSDLTVKSIVQRLDWTSTQPHKVEFSQKLTNWKSKK